jgi:hypothetical protein
MTREQRKSLTVAVIGVLTLMWLIYCGAVAVNEYRQPTTSTQYPLCIDAPEVTCIVPNYEDAYTGENS